MTLVATKEDSLVLKPSSCLEYKSHQGILMIEDYHKRFSVTICHLYCLVQYRLLMPTVQHLVAIRAVRAVYCCQDRLNEAQLQQLQGAMDNYTSDRVPAAVATQLQRGAWLQNYYIWLCKTSQYLCPSSLLALTLSTK